MEDFAVPLGHRNKESKVKDNGIIVVTEKLMGKKDYHQHETSCKSCLMYCSVLRNFAYSTPLWLGYKQKVKRKSYKNARLCCRPELKLLYDREKSNTKKSNSLLYLQKILRAMYNLIVLKPNKIISHN